MLKEKWRQIDEFPTYSVSNLGRVHDDENNQEVFTSPNQYGHVRVNLWLPDRSARRTRSVALLVATAFIEPPDFLSDHVILLDGDLQHVSSENLAWRPRWFAWKYSRQLRIPQPLHYHNLKVRNVTLLKNYSSVIEAGMTEGLLFRDIWRSTYTEAAIYPQQYVFIIIERV